VVLRTNWAQEVNLAVARSEAQKMKQTVRQELATRHDDNEQRPLISDEARDSA
jgi:hypothetical protein